MNTAAPPRNPVACGALGPYDPDLAAAVAAALPAPMSSAHSDRRSCLYLDRAAIRWRAGLARGWAWSELGPVAPQRPRAEGWQEVALEHDCCGLVAGPRDRFVHSSGTGVAPVYWVDHDGATYFATSIDALAQAVPGHWSCDWGAWASIFTVRYPIGDATPFTEVRRLPQFSRLIHRDGRGQVRRDRWPLIDVEPTVSLDEGIDASLDALRERVALLREHEVVALLSGGFDSRVLLCLLDELGIERRALTLSHDGRAASIEVETATAAARASRTPHEVLAPSDPARHWEFWLRRTRDCDFQVVVQPWLTRLGDRLGELSMPVVDGLAVDVYGFHAGRNFSADAVAAEGVDEAHVFWANLRRGGLRETPAVLLGAGPARAFARESRRQFGREWRRLSDSSSSLVLLHYLTRTVRGISPMPQSVLGAVAPVITPGTGYRFAEATLRVPIAEKLDNRFYRSLLSRLDSPAASEPIEQDRRYAMRKLGQEGAPLAPPLRFRREVAARYEEALRDGPLFEYLGPDLRAALDDGDFAEAAQRHSIQRAAMLGATFNLWYRAYEDRLGEVDPAELADLAPA